MRTLSIASFVALVSALTQSTTVSAQNQGLSVYVVYAQPVEHDRFFAAEKRAIRDAVTRFLQSEGFVPVSSAEIERVDAVARQGSRLGDDTHAVCGLPVPPSELYPIAFPDTHHAEILFRCPNGQLGEPTEGCKLYVDIIRPDGRTLVTFRSRVFTEVPTVRVVERAARELLDENVSRDDGPVSTRPRAPVIGSPGGVSIAVLSPSAEVPDPDAGNPFSRCNGAPRCLDLEVAPHEPQPQSWSSVDEDYVEASDLDHASSTRLRACVVPLGGIRALFARDRRGRVTTCEARTPVGDPPGDCVCTAMRNFELPRGRVTHRDWRGRVRLGSGSASTSSPSAQVVDVRVVGAPLTSAARRINELNESSLLRACSTRARPTQWAAPPWEVPIEWTISRSGVVVLTPPSMPGELAQTTIDCLVSRLSWLRFPCVQGSGPVRVMASLRIPAEL